MCVWLKIGNPLLEFNTDFNARGEYLWSHGLISDDTYELFNHICNYSQIRRQVQMDSLTPVCHRVITQASREISEFINSYDVTLDICLSTVGSQAEVLNRLVGSMSFPNSGFSLLIISYSVYRLKLHLIRYSFTAKYKDDKCLCRRWNT